MSTNNHDMFSYEECLNEKLKMLNAFFKYMTNYIDGIIRSDSLYRTKVYHGLLPCKPHVVKAPKMVHYNYNCTEKGNDIFEKS